MTSWLATRGFPAVAAIVMFCSIIFAVICLGATLMTLMIWGDVPLGVMAAGVVSTLVAIGSGVFLFRSTDRWPD